VRAIVDADVLLLGRLARRTASNSSVEAEGGDPVGPHEPILRAEDHALQIGLRNDQPVERIIMVTREPTSELRMAPSDRWKSRTRAPAR
jgi:hypothetical protein